MLRAGPYRRCISASRRSTVTSSPSGLVVMSQQVSTLESSYGAGSNSRPVCRQFPVLPLQRWHRSDGRPVGIAGRRPGERRGGSVRRRVRAGRSRPGRVCSRCRGATPRLRAGRPQRRERMPACAPAATPWTCAQRRGRRSWRRCRERSSAHKTSTFMRPRLGARCGTFTDVACHLKTS